MGVAFANGTTEVNALRLWVDRQLPPSVAGAYAFTAWSSDDNLSWTQVPVTGPVTFGVFENRFEIPIVRTQARYLKVVTRPITTAVTSDPQYRAVLVTELQPFLVVPASEAPRTSQQWGGNFNGSARLLILQDWNLAYTLGFNTSHEGSLDFRDWSVLNSLSAGRQVAPGVFVNAQISRTDSAQTNLPHEATNRWSAQIGYDPYQTLGLSFTYSGQYGQLFQGDVLSNSVTLVGRVDPWQGVSLAATGGYSWARDAAGRRLESPNATVGITLVPMQALTISGTWGVSSSIVTGTGGPVQGDSTTSLQGSLSFTPVRAIYFTRGDPPLLRGGNGAADAPQLRRRLLSLHGRSAAHPLRLRRERGHPVADPEPLPGAQPALEHPDRDLPRRRLHLERHLPARTPDTVANPVRQPVHQLPVTRPNPPTRGRDHA